MSVPMPSPRIVVPLDGSDFAVRAIPVAAVIARTAGAGLTLVGVATDDAQAASLTQHLHQTSAELPVGTDVALLTRRTGFQLRSLW